MKTKDEYIACLKTKLKEWDAQINHLITLIHSGEIEALRAKQLVATEKMKELQESKDDAWVSVAITANKVWDDLRRSIANTSSKYYHLDTSIGE